VRIIGQDTVNTISKPQAQTNFDSAKPSPGAGPVTQNSVASTDWVDLAGQSGLLSLAQNTSGDTRAAQLEQLRALVQSGQYEVDTNALSQAIVTSAMSGY